MDVALPLAIDCLQSMQLTLDFTWQLSEENRLAMLSHDKQTRTTAAACIRREQRLLARLVAAFFDDSYFSSVTIPSRRTLVHDYGLAIRAVVAQPHLRLMVRLASVSRRWFGIVQAAILMEAYPDPIQIALESLDRDYACQIYGRDEFAILRIPFDAMSYLPVQLIRSPRTT